MKLKKRKLNENWVCCAFTKKNLTRMCLKTCLIAKKNEKCNLGLILEK